MYPKHSDEIVADYDKFKWNLLSIVTFLRIVTDRSFACPGLKKSKS